MAVRAKGFIPKHRASLHKVTTVGLNALTAAHIFWLNPEKSKKKEPRGSQVAAASQQSTLSQRGGGFCFVKATEQRSVFPHEKKAHGVRYYRKHAKQMFNPRPPISPPPRNTYPY